MSYRSEYKTLYYRRQHETRNFYLLIYKSEYEKIQSWTDKHQDLETGGDLFGLWASDNTAVVQLIVGPGKNCKRTAASFYQDLDYLEQLGNLLTNEEGLCHIGEWHSHHRLSLPRPSGGDEDTVWTNMNRYGLSRFCLLIANIKGSWYRSETTPRDVTVNGFLFEVDSIKKRRLPVLEGEFRFLQEESPLRLKNIDALCKGAEDSLVQRDVPLNYQAMELDLKRHVQRIKELEKSLASEKDAREQTERKRQGCEKRLREREKSLTLERQAKEEALKQLRCSEQRSRDFEISLTAERKAKEAALKQLRCSEQRSRDFEISLTAERKAKEEALKQLRCSEQRLRDLEETLAEERQTQARKDGEKQLHGRKIRSSEPGASLAEERNARHLAKDRLRDFKHRSNELETSLAAERNTRLETGRHLQRSEQEQSELRNSLTAERQAKDETERKLQHSEQRSRDLETALNASMQANEETERRLQHIKQKYKQLEETLSEEREKRKDVEKQLQPYDSKMRSIHPGTSFAEERSARQLAEGRRRNVKHRPNELETSLVEERNTRVKLEERLRQSEQRSRELEASLTAERQAKEETERRVQRSELRSRELETFLTTERQAKEETERRLQRSEQRSRDFEISLSVERKEKEETLKQLQRSEQRSRDLKTSLTVERQVKEETESRLQRSEHRSRDLETSLVAERNTRVDLEERLRRHEQRSRELETTLATVQQDFEEYRSSKESSCDWILAGNEIALSDKVIGEGGWGKVIEGTFGGCQVAVKKIHQPIASLDDRDLFQREISIAFRCRHPCLLEIIGATVDDERPLIVTELMDNNLRAVLDERALEATEITTIALDVAKGLNYLHLRRPRPIIHGRISSANVLLWRRGSDGWRTKLSDYGTANFLKQSKNICLGSDIYSAPEARAQPSTQSPKTDVYSFGVLLFEMEIRELPNVVDRDKQIAKVKQHYRRIIRRCMRTKPEDRFNAMADIIEVMEKSQ